MSEILDAKDADTTELLTSTTSSNRIDLAFILRDTGGDIAAAQRRIDAQASTPCEVSEDEVSSIVTDMCNQVSILVPAADELRMAKVLSLALSRRPGIPKARIEALERVAEAGFAHGVICLVCSQRRTKHAGSCWYGKALSALDGLGAG